MTEADWLAATEPVPMLKLLKGRASDRKLRLFLVASARLAWDRVPAGAMRDAVDAAELYADAAVPVARVDDYRGHFYTYVMPGVTPEQYDWVQSPDKRPVFTLVRMTVYTDPML